MTTTTPELALIKYILIYKYYIKYYSYIYKYIKDSNKEIEQLLKAIQKLFTEKGNKEEDISIEELELFLSVEYSNEFDVLFKPIVDSLRTITIDESIILSLLDKIKDRSIASDLAVLSLEVSEGLKTVEDIFSKIGEFTAKDTETTSDIFVETDLSLLYEDQVKRQGLRWRLKPMNEMLGSLRTGDFGFVFARPETGKTTFLASETTYFAEQATGPILWFNNEEQGKKVMLRCYQAALGLTREQLFGDIDGNKKRYYDLTGDRIRIFDSANISKRDVERLCESHRPSLVVFDQIDKIKGFDEDREDLRLGGIYIWAREIAKTYCPVIGVCQANGDGEGRAYLTMDHVSNAKTAKQAEADWILGIGMVHNEALRFQRGLHLSKNKLTGDEDTIPDLRHGKVDVKINPEIARYVPN
jgi:hypothetical protein